MKIRTTALTVSLLAGVVSLAYAQPAAVPAWGPIPFEAFDRDGNGLVSQQEYDAVRYERRAARVAEGRRLRRAASAPGYSDIDLNHDNAISRDELARHQDDFCNRRGR